MSLRQLIYIILSCLAISNCSKNSQESLNGYWFVDHNSFDGLIRISQDTVVTLFYRSSEKEEILSISGDRYSIPEFNNRPDGDLGIIQKIDDEKVAFSNGLTLYRLIGKTSTKYSEAELAEKFKNSIWEYRFGDEITRLYLTDAPTSWSTNYTTIVYGEGSSADVFESWVITSFQKKIFLIHLTRYLEAVFIEFDTINDNRFDGSLYFYGEKGPVTGKLIPPSPPETIENIESLLFGTTFKTISTRLYDIQEEFPDSIEVEPTEKVVEEWNSYTSPMSITQKEVEKNPFSFSFLPNKTMNIYKHGDLVRTAKWFVSGDGKYILIHYKNDLVTFFKASNLFEKPINLSFQMTVYIGDKKGVEQTDLEFTIGE